MKELPILDPTNVTIEVCKREMRVYLVKSEFEFQALAYRKYLQDLESGRNNSRNGSQEKNYSNSRTKEATNSDGTGTRGGRGSRGSKGSKGSRGRGQGMNSLDDFTSGGSGGGSGGK